MSRFNREFGERLMKARDKAGIKSVVLARRLNVHVNSVYRWEAGNTPRIAMIPEMCRLLRVSADWLLGV